MISRSIHAVFFFFFVFYRRLMTTPTHRELYVCHQDGVAQDLVDLAFHLGLGAPH